MTGYEVYDYVRRFSGQDPYIDGLYYKLDQMNLEQRQFFAQEIAPKYMNLDGTLNLNQSKSMERLAMLTLKGLDARGLAGMEYQNIIQAERIGAIPPVNFQPYLQQVIDEATNVQQPNVQPVVQPERSKQDMINNINNLINQYVSGASNRTFCQSTNVTVNSLANQGWKFHISVDSLEEYEKLCEVAIPEFQQLGVKFKVVRPELLEDFNESTQQGKAFTIYPDPSFSFKNFSPQLQSLLCQDSEIKPLDDMQIAGKIFARYGRFRGAPIKESYITRPDSNIDRDPKAYHGIMPKFFTSRDTNKILNFYDNALEKFNKTGDFKTYMQEYYTMAECDGKSHSYMCVEIPANNIDMANALLSISHKTQDESGKEVTYAPNNKFGLSFVCTATEDVARVMIHKSDIPQAFYTLANNSILAQRPEWDVKYTYHEIAPGQEKNAVGLAQEMNAKYNMQAISVVEVENGKFALKCDSVFNREALDMCIDRALPIRDYEPHEKGSLTKFVEKLTGKDISFVEKDVTNSITPDNSTRDNQQMDNIDNEER